MSHAHKHIKYEPCRYIPSRVYNSAFLYIISKFTNNIFLEKYKLIFMEDIMWGLIVALISGALMSVQGVFNTGVTKQTSTWLASAWVAFSGFVVAFVLWAIFERQQAGIMSLTKVDNKYMLLGGVIGAFITWTVITSMSSLGPAKAVLAIVICQLLVAYLIELLGWFGVEKVDFQWSKLIGIVVSIVGFIIFKWEK